MIPRIPQTGMHETPIPASPGHIAGRLVLLTRPIRTSSPKHWLKHLYEQQTRRPYEGHRSVIQSCMRGLQKSGQHFSLNPTRLPLDTTAILVCWGHDTIQYASLLKRTARKNAILALASVAVSLVPEQINAIVDNQSEIDLILPMSEWQKWRFKELYGRHLPDHKFRVWPGGVDPVWWSPSNETKHTNRHLLIYHKRCPEKLFEGVRNAASIAGWTSEVVTYGKYSPEQFRSALNRCRVAVFLSDWESHGLALAEAWSMDVPTLAWHPDPGASFQYTGPYVGPGNGKLFQDAKHLRELLEMPDPCGEVFPRNWVLEHMTDEVSAGILLGHLHSVALEASEKA